ncbi:MBL fold metallo-hydrolase [Arthrobacter mobilis]|uniref:MBL fold metallo-hydrolase n=1 Tax=Arthrobacter mobilis TaxID=2724944 RepID=A0A7X6K607_9MICC|nr:MBL fold metallo-hydrolase [Arthrobacter mobilis]NKX54530.1 MBL fold metallo-hydrolase [Arthrobacter mobilis]
MLLTKYTHACVRLENDGEVLVIDPGTFSEVEEALRGAGTVLVTHEHADHVDLDRLPGILAAGTLHVYAPARVAEQLRSLTAALPSGTADGTAAERIHTVEPDAGFEVPGFRIRTFGGQHALIHPLIPVVANIGYLVNETVYHPGDSFVVPHGLTAPAVLVPVHAPWNKVSEVIDFVTAMRARRAYPIHDGLLNETGRGLVEKHVASFGARYGTSYEHLDPGQSVDLDAVREG